VCTIKERLAKAIAIEFNEEEIEQIKLRKADEEEIKALAISFILKREDVVEELDMMGERLKDQIFKGEVESIILLVKDKDEFWFGLKAEGNDSKKYIELIGEGMLGIQGFGLYIRAAQHLVSVTKEGSGGRIR
jgi:hypothetical protein